MTCRPGHAPRHPDFEPGNVVAMIHGADSERRWRPIAEQLKAWLAEVAPWTQHPSSAMTVEDWAEYEARHRLIAQYLDEHGDLDDAGDVRGAARWGDRLATRAANLRAELGLSPLALARLLGAVSLVADRLPDGPGQLAALRAAGAATEAAARPPALPAGEA